MESQDWRESEDFFKRFLLQGKIISQLITFWWRYDENPGTKEIDQKKIETAKLLKKLFFPGFPDASPGRISFASPSLIELFKADPRSHINEENPEEYVDILITIFGRDRICNEKTYLSPIFNSTELGLENGNNLARYEFKIDTSGTKFGKLTDPEIVIEEENSLLKYIYIIPIPDRPGTSDNFNNIYQQWISNENDLYPSNQLIPFTT
ncbi:hypothetical protein [Nostoc sp. FACHB-190]|uniref:hypothetical protein n=1 Tax=Nostoc sp. FACHB-190 TaxID=2692838 RepID=UPI001686EF66|nr:hypothetical protein [Nostoc sp. FACHB-190]MBD2302310.1 hypothetical protein [Nostoc sp. FACHB-190]